MKKITLFVILFVFQKAVLMSQDVKTRKWAISTVGIKVAPDFNHKFSNLTYQTIETLVKDPSQLKYDMEGFEEYDSFEMYGTTVGAYINISKDINEHFSRDWQLGINAYAYAELYTDYKKPQSSIDDYLGWCLIQNRFELDLAHFVRYNHARFSLYAGLSGSFGASFNDRVMLFEEEESFEPSQITEAHSTRFVYIHGLLGVSIPLYKKLAFVYEIKRGKGMQLGEDNQITSRAGLVGFEYRIGR